MIPQFNFPEASTRHWKAADSLENNHPESADHFFGLSAECALKGVMVTLGFSTTSSGDLTSKDHQEHIDQLWAQFRFFLHGRPGAQYAARLGKTNPFNDWKVSQRYWGNGHVTPERLKAHRAGAYGARGLLEQVNLDRRAPSK